MGNIVTVSVSRVSINVRRLQVILIGNMKTSGSLCECGYRDGDIYVQLSKSLHSAEACVLACM